MSNMIGAFVRSITRKLKLGGRYRKTAKVAEGGRRKPKMGGRHRKTAKVAGGSRHRKH